MKKASRRLNEFFRRPGHILYRLHGDKRDLSDPAQRREKRPCHGLRHASRPDTAPPVRIFRLEELPFGGLAQPASGRRQLSGLQRRPSRSRIEAGCGGALRGGAGAGGLGTGSAPPTPEGPGAISLFERLALLASRYLVGSFVIDPALGGSLLGSPETIRSQPLDCVAARRALPHGTFPQNTCREPIHDRQPVETISGPLDRRGSPRARPASK
ncbi:MAG: hypothetical protein MZV70_76030 [Desulfobacterales bacterium]|nr:hypothetical protein [Desulfobacterales bacterium]